MDLEAPLRSLLASQGLLLYDVQLHGATLEVTVDREGGVDLDALTEASRSISRWLDDNDPIPGHYTLDVASPGLERRLRTPEHFARAVGEVVTLRVARAGEPARRLEGTLMSATEDAVTIDDAQAGLVEVALRDVERARTVFHWEPAAAKRKG